MLISSNVYVIWGSRVRVGDAASKRLTRFLIKYGSVDI